MRPLLRLPLLGMALLPVATALLEPSPPLCGVTVRRVGSHTVPLSQQLVLTTIAPGCVHPASAVVRYRTAGGGILPPVGYLRLRPTYPRHDRYWLRPGGSVQIKRAGEWITVWRSGG